MVQTALLILCVVGGVSAIAIGISRNDTLTGIAGALALAASLFGLLG
jgi:hypothetical protein